MSRSSKKGSRRRWGRVAVVAALISGLILVLSGPASASDDETMATEVVDVFLSDQGVNVRDDVRDVIEDDVVGAIRVGAVLWATLNQIGFSWSSSESSATSTTDPLPSFPGELLRERIRERIQLQLRIWDFIAPEWRDVHPTQRESSRMSRRR